MKGFEMVFKPIGVGENGMAKPIKKTKALLIVTAGA
jgi:hypothetical protein